MARQRRRLGKKNKMLLNFYDYSIALIGESGIGKEQPLSSEIITPEGIKTMGDMKVGSKVIGHDGKAHNVIGVYPQGVKPIYKVEFSDGSVVECGLDHLWKTQSKKQRENGNYSIRTLREMLEDYDAQAMGYKYSVQLPEAVEFEQKEELPIPAYLLGVLLGDGSLNTHTAQVKNSEQDILDRAIASFLNYYDDGAVNQYNDSRVSFHGDSRLMSALRDFDLNTTSRHKYIPHEYLFASKENRQALLEGLVDTDGSISKGVSIRYSSYSKELAKGVRFLAKSLGFASTFKEHHRADGDVEYYVQIMGDISTLNLSNKHTSKITKRTFDYALTIRNIEYVRDEEAQCIMVDNPEHLYLTNDFIVTHNTTLIYEVCDKYLGEDGYIFFNIGREEGLDALPGVIYEDVETFEDLVAMVDDIVEYKQEDYPELKMVVWDTLDELTRLAYEYTLDEWNRDNPTKRAKSIKATHGGLLLNMSPRILEDITIY